MERRPMVRQGWLCISLDRAVSASCPLSRRLDRWISRETGRHSFESIRACFPHAVRDAPNPAQQTVGHRRLPISRTAETQPGSVVAVPLIVIDSIPELRLAISMNDLGVWRVDRIIGVRRIHSGINRHGRQTEFLQHKIEYRLLP